jgi:hypothetical protein
VPTKTKAPSKPSTIGKPIAGAKPMVKPAVSIQPTSGDYVHFSDKMTGALENISQVIDDNRGTLDSIQDMALELTHTIQFLRAVVIRYVDMADDILKTIIPILDRLPIVPDKVVNFAKEALELAEKITAASDMAQKVLPGVESSLRTADISGLQASKSDMANLTRALQDMVDIN